MQSIDDLMGLDVDSLLTEDIQVNKGPKMHRWTYRSHELLLPHWDNSTKMQIVPKPEEAAQKKKAISKETNFISIFLF